MAGSALAQGTLLATESEIFRRCSCLIGSWGLGRLDDNRRHCSCRGGVGGGNKAAHGSVWEDTSGGNLVGVLCPSDFLCAFEAIVFVLVLRLGEFVEVSEVRVFVFCIGELVVVIRRKPPTRSAIECGSSCHLFLSFPLFPIYHLLVLFANDLCLPDLFA